VTSAALILSSCSSDSDSSDKNSEATREYTAENGTHEIPETPNRIVTIGGAVGSTISLGVHPVGVTDQGSSFSDWLDDKQREAYQSATNIGSISELDYEKIASLDPDLILISAPPQVFESSIDGEALQRVAPTLLFTPPQGDAWKENIEKIGDIVGASDAAETDRGKYDALVQEIRSEYSDVLNSTSFAFINKWAPSDTTNFDREYAGFTCTNYAPDLGINIAGSEKTEDGGNTKKFSLENLTDLNSVDAIIYPLDVNGKEKEGLDSVFNSSLWKNLSPVTDDKVEGVQCPPGTFTYTNGIRNLESMKTALAAIAKE
jgi:iron complex transport system substrate-binding protein